MILALLSPLLLLAASANAACSTFSTVKILTRDEIYSGFAGQVVDSERLRISPGIVCGDPNATPQSYGPFKDSLAYDCKPNQCFLAIHGNYYSWAQTNITHSTVPDSSNAAGRIAELARTNAAWPRNRDIERVVTVFADLGGGHVCVGNGTSGYLRYIPSFYCAEGVLGGCGHGNGVETNGTPVTVCLPGKLKNVVPPLDGSLAIIAAPPKVVEKLKDNPAAKLKHNPVSKDEMQNHQNGAVVAGRPAVAAGAAVAMAILSLALAV